MINEMANGEILRVFGGLALSAAFLVVVIVGLGDRPSIIHDLTVAMLSSCVTANLFLIIPAWRKITELRKELKETRLQHNALIAEMRRAEENAAWGFA